MSILRKERGGRQGSWWCDFGLLSWTRWLAANSKRRSVDTYYTVLSCHDADLVTDTGDLSVFMSLGTQD